MALVTGGNRGIGLAIVKGLAKEGMTVLLGCRNVSEGQLLTDEITGDVHAVVMDLSSKETIEQSLTSLTASYPKVDVLVNNAGILDESKFKDISYDGLLESMHINAFAPFLLAQYFAANMEKSGYGRIVNVSSGWGAQNGLLDSPILYGLSKSSLNALTRIVASKTSKKVKVNAFCPGWVRTDMGGMFATRSPAKGAETAIWLATLDSKGPDGQFFRDKKAINW